MIHLTFPGQPLSTQHIYKFTHRGAYMNRDGVVLKQSYQWEIKRKPRGPVITKEIKVKIELYFPDKRKRDVDNFNKIILDACNNLLWEDDSQIIDLRTLKFIDKDKPRVELYIE